MLTSAFAESPIAHFPEERLKRRFIELHNKLKERSTGGAQAVQQAMEKAKKRKGKKERMREKAVAAATAGEGGAGESDGDEDD